MGLDMYLSGKKYVKDWAHQYPEGSVPEETTAKLVQKVVGLNLPVTYVEVEVGYWRKANHIHKWFVDNVQGGEDECRPHEVYDEHLEELRRLCKEVLADHSKAEELLPCGGGFFFGGTEYDEYYFGDLKDTVAIIDKALELENRDMAFEYRSSW